MKSVLIVEDEASSQALAIQALQSMGDFSISVADDGAAALRLYDSMPAQPDYILCDIFLPDTDGIEVVNELATRKFAGGLILITAGDNQYLEIAKAMALASGLKLLAALRKPLQPEDLPQAIEQRQGGLQTA